ncbi:MAG: shikimate kinase [Gammaproteobacteria bacterium]|nr:MAG: shikimate kinase [Gammaproteobacteria bacterium]
MSKNIILIGPMGAGKTTVGRKLAQYLKCPFVDVDEVIEKRLGVSITTIFETEGEAKFRQRELAILGDILAENQHAVIATGGGCVLTEACRRLIVCQRLVVYLDVGLEQQYQRLQYDKKRPILQSGNLREKLKILRKQRHYLYQELADLHILSDQIGFRQTLRLIEKAMHNS